MRYIGYEQDLAIASSNHIIEFFEYLLYIYVAMKIKYLVQSMHQTILVQVQSSEESGGQKNQNIRNVRVTNMYVL